VYTENNISYDSIELDEYLEEWEQIGVIEQLNIFSVFLVTTLTILFKLG
jgi:hypothetical protein